MNVSRELVLIAKDILGSYPDTPPSEKDRKKWREKAEEIRRHDGIKPRKAGESVKRIFA